MSNTLLLHNRYFMFGMYFTHTIQKLKKMTVAYL